MSAPRRHSGIIVWASYPLPNGNGGERGNAEEEEEEKEKDAAAADWRAKTRAPVLCMQRRRFYHTLEFFLVMQ
jgi:hypothetical protein